MTKKTPSATAPIKRSIAPATPTIHDITRHVPDQVQAILWGKAAGRCEFAGCNRPLWKSSVTQEQVNIGQKAHIYAFSTDGPRGNKGIPKKKLNDLGNLMLVCHECHRKIDKEKDGGRYTAPVLQAMKADHEKRIETVTGIAVNKKSHVLLYGANIGEYSSPLEFNEAALALFPQRYAAEASAIVLGTINSSFEDRDATFWKVESENLQRLFDRRVRERLAAGEIDHLSVFALAPQPLLVLLGTLLGDIANVDVFQRHREPPTWAWPESAVTPLLEVQEPSLTVGPPALVLALSATVTTERITAVLGLNACIWTVTLPTTHNDAIKSRHQLSQFRALLRPLLDRIKAVHGQNTPLHVFPAGPVSVAVEFGRIRMPKADMPWVMHDQLNARGGFVPVLSIPKGVL